MARGREGQIHSHVTKAYTNRFDTSSIIVFDDFVEDGLRAELLEVVRGEARPEQLAWNDAKLGPDPMRWVRGGLDAVPIQSTCWLTQI